VNNEYLPLGALVERIHRMLEKMPSLIKATVKGHREALETELTMTIEENTETIQKDVRELVDKVEAIGETLENTEGTAECVQEDVMHLRLVVEALRHTLIDLRNLELHHIATTVSTLNERMDNLESEVSEIVTSSSETLEDIKSTVHETLEQREDFYDAATQLLRRLGSQVEPHAGSVGGGGG
jgi:chromosome segregation ATPase